MKKPLIAFGVLVAFGFFLSFLQGPKQPTDGARIQKVEVPWQEKEDFSNALWYAKKEVQARLKSPSTAKFPPSSHDIGRVRYVGDQKYIIASHVDAQNSFGATIRAHYLATIIQYDKGKWRVEEVVFMDN
jgi:hypothetical protein